MWPAHADAAVCREPFTRSSDKEQEALLPLFQLAVPTDGGVAVWLTAHGSDDDRLWPHVRLVLNDGPRAFAVDLAPASAAVSIHDGAHGRWRTLFWTAATPPTAVVTALHLRVLVPERHTAAASIRVGAIRVAASTALAPPTPWLKTAVPCTGLARTADATGVSWTLLDPGTIVGCHVLVDGRWVGYTGGTVWSLPSGSAASSVRIVPVRHDGWTWWPDACPILA